MFAPRNWEVDRSQYDEWEGFIADLLREGVRVMTYINPMLVANISERGTPFIRDLYAEAHAKGYLVRQGSDVWLGYSSAALVDLTNPDARTWLKAVIKTQMLQSGVSGWMSDFGEACPLDATLFSGVSGARYHSQYPADWAQLNREVRFPKCAWFMHYRYGPGASCLASPGCFVCVVRRPSTSTRRRRAIPLWL